MTFKKESEIYTSMKNYLQSLLGFEPGRIFCAILRVSAAAIRLLYVTLEYLYWDIFATYADRAALRRFYEDWGLTWDNPTTEQARKTVLNQYRQKSCGTKQWFEDTVKFNFDTVTQATATIGARGLNTVDIAVSYHNHPVPDDTIQEIQDYMDADDKKICAIDVLIKSIEITQEAE